MRTVAQGSHPVGPRPGRRPWLLALAAKAMGIGAATALTVGSFAAPTAHVWVAPVRVVASPAGRLAPSLAGPARRRRPEAKRYVPPKVVLGSTIVEIQSVY